jgi:hypothetical protein
MAMLNESNLLAMKAKAAKFRTHHVGTKLNEAELHEFEALAERRKQTPSELIRGLVLGEIERDQQPPRPSAELEEITALRLLFINVLPKLATGRFISPDPLMAMPERLLDPQEWNMYSYGRNNPLSFSDPTGL